MKHTPGPWNVGGVITAAKEIGICQMMNTAEKEQDDSIFANAALIAAAPQLLESAHFAIWQIVGVLSSEAISSEMRDSLNDAKEQLEVAIMTAEGE